MGTSLLQDNGEKKSRAHDSSNVTSNINLESNVNFCAIFSCLELSKTAILLGIFTQRPLPDKVLHRLPCADSRSLAYCRCCIQGPEAGAMAAFCKDEWRWRCDCYGNDL